MKLHTTHIQQQLTPHSICLHAPMQYIHNTSRVPTLNNTLKYNNIDTAVVCAKQLHQQAICNGNFFARITQLEDNDTEPRLKFNAKSVPGCHSHSKSSNITAWSSAYLVCLSSGNYYYLRSADTTRHTPSLQDHHVTIIQH